MIIDVLLKLLRMTCLECHHFRIKPIVKEDFQVILLLVKHGLVNEATTFWETDSTTENRKLKKLEKAKFSEKNE